MNRTVMLVLLVLACAVAAGGASLADASPSATAPRTITFLAVDVRTGEASVDVGAKGDSVGDSFYFQETLHRRAGAKAVGHTEVACTLLSREASRCSGTLYLPNGKIEASGAIHFRRTFRIAIVGGTGAYAGAGGEMVITSLGETRDRYMVRLVD
jgi:hypothetical protein